MANRKILSDERKRQVSKIASKAKKWIVERTKWSYLSAIVRSPFAKVITIIPILGYIIIYGESFRDWFDFSVSIGDSILILNADQRSRYVYYGAIILLLSWAIYYLFAPTQCKRHGNAENAADEYTRIGTASDIAKIVSKISIEISRNEFSIMQRELEDLALDVASLNEADFFGDRYILGDMSLIRLAKSIQSGAVVPDGVLTKLHLNTLARAVFEMPSTEAFAKERGFHLKVYRSFLKNVYGAPSGRKIPEVQESEIRLIRALYGTDDKSKRIPMISVGAISLAGVLFTSAPAADVFGALLCRDFKACLVHSYSARNKALEEDNKVCIANDEIVELNEPVHLTCFISE